MSANDRDEAMTPDTTGPYAPANVRQGAAALHSLWHALELANAHLRAACRIAQEGKDPSDELRRLEHTARAACDVARRAPKGSI